MTASTLHNKILDISNLPPITFGRGNEKHQQGLPAGAFWQKPYTFDDANHDGLISQSEVKLSADTSVFIGPVLSTFSHPVSGDLTLLRYITLSTLFDWRGGNYGTPLPLATGIEARLIEAEAALKAGDATTWLTRLNGLRAQFSALMPKIQPDRANQISKTTITARTLAPLTDPGTADARLALMFKERAYWLFTTGHRLGDMRRLMRQYGKADTDVFPTGSYFKGGSFGHDVAFPIPFNEQQNPNYKPDQCSTTAA